MDGKKKTHQPFVLIHVSVLISVLHQEQSMNQKLVVFLFMIGIQVLCMWFRRRRKGGRHLQYLCTEFCTFLVLLGQSTIVLRFDQEPSTLSLLEAEKDMQSTWYQNH